MGQDATTLQEAVLVASVLLAAIAALASWASVLQTRRLSEKAQAPLLVVEAGIYADGTVGAVVTNAGPGMAQRTTVYLTHGYAYVEGSIGHGFSPGATKHVRTSIQITTPDIETRVVVACRDRSGRLHSWDGDDRHRVLGNWRRRPRDQRIVETFIDHYPDIDPLRMDSAQMAVVEE